MIIIVLGILGALMGGFTARKRRGNHKDIAQYAVGFAMAFMVVGMILTVILDRLLSVA
ncbi:MAG: apolipoprotein acyltransferase [Sulfitobacter sp.]